MLDIFYSLSKAFLRLCDPSNGQPYGRKVVCGRGFLWYVGFGSPMSKVESIKFLMMVLQFVSLFDDDDDASSKIFYMQLTLTLSYRLAHHSYFCMFWYYGTLGAS
jgi:hypothetical protein